MKVPKGKSFTVGQKTYEAGEEIPDEIAPKSWSKPDSKPDKGNKPKPK